MKERKNSGDVSQNAGINQQGQATNHPPVNQEKDQNDDASGNESKNDDYSDEYDLYNPWC